MLHAINKVITIAVLCLAATTTFSQTIYEYRFQGEQGMTLESGSGIIVTGSNDLTKPSQIYQASGILTDATDDLYKIYPKVIGVAYTSTPYVYDNIGITDNRIGGTHLVSNTGIVLAAVRERATAYFADQMTYFRIYWEDQDQYGSGYRVEVYMPGYAAEPLHRAPISLVLVKK